MDKTNSETPISLDAILIGAIRQAVRQELQSILGQNGHREDKLLSAEQAAERWGIPVSWIRDQARQGKLPHIRLGHYMRFKSDDLDRFIKERRK